MASNAACRVDDDRRSLIDLWVDVTNAGGAVGFVPPVGPDEVAGAADRLVTAAAAGQRLLITATDDGALVGTVAIVPETAPYFAHRVTLVTLMVSPERQGEGLGRRLVERAHEVAVERCGARISLVGVRGGQGLEPFYERCGYTRYARLPGGVRYGEDEFDDVGMYLTLPTPTAD